MDDYVKEALEIVKAQAGVRIMTEAEVTSMVARLSADIKRLATAENQTLTPQISLKEAKKAIREKSIINLEDGTAHKVLTKKKLAKFGLTPDEYRQKWGYKKGQPLICKALQRERRQKMQDMKLWERRNKKF